METIRCAKIGIFGGAFDPPHKSHVEMARAVMRERGYEKLVFLPSNKPPHKQLTTSNYHRLNMLKLTLSSEFEICEIELENNQVNYAVDYLPKLKEIYGEDIELIIGGDSIVDFHKWKDPAKILQLSKLLVVARNNKTTCASAAIAKLESHRNLGITLAKYKPKQMSSSDIRNKLRLGYDVTEWLGGKIITYIKDNNLYNEYYIYRSKLQRELSVERYNHSMSVALFALSNMSGLNLDYDKVMIAAMLHDCGKERKETEELIEYNKVHFAEIMSSYEENRAVEHAFTGMAIAAIDYKVTDMDIIKAIAYHTTGRAKMSELEKLIYVADKIETTRDYLNIEKLRAIYSTDKQAGFLALLRTGYQHLLDIKVEVHSLNESAYKYYLEDDKYGL